MPRKTRGEALSQDKINISAVGTVGTFLGHGTCSETLIRVLDRAFGRALVQEERATAPLAGGIMSHGYQCGMIWGAPLAAGARAYRLFGAGPMAEARSIRAAQRLVDSFVALNRNMNCLEITDLNLMSSSAKQVAYFVLKGGAVGCFRMAARYAPVAFQEIQTAFSEEPPEVPPAPVSCSAMVARAMGATDFHAVMASGLAGGIGLSGGACGALGAAIWVSGLNKLEDGARKVAYKSPEAMQIVECFLKCSDYEFECSKIVGRKFESLRDHAAHLRLGGCSKILEVLAAR
jgi:hypothetical protein